MGFGRDSFERFDLPTIDPEEELFFPSLCTAIRSCFGRFFVLVLFLVIENETSESVRQMLL